MPARSTPVPPEIVARLRAICLALPQAREEPAWVGIRWRIGKHTFAHVLGIDAGWPPAYAAATGSPGPQVVLTFRSPLCALNAYAFSTAPFFKPRWFADIAGVVLDEHTDWDEVGGLLIQSYRHLAPGKLPPQAG